MKAITTNATNMKDHVEGRVGAGLEFKLFICYLTFVYFNPQDIIPFIRPLRPPLILAIASLIVCFSRKRIGVFAFPQSKLLLVFMIITIISTFNSIDFSFSLGYLETWIKGFAFYLLVVFNTDTRDRLTRFIRVMIVFMFVNAVFTFVAGKIGLMPPKMRMVSYFGGGGANDFALMLLAHAPYALVLFERTRDKRKRAFLVVAALAFLGCLTRTRSRMGFLGAGILMLQVAWAKRRKPGYILLLAGICIFVAVNTHSSYFNRVETITDESEAESIRIGLWRQALQVMGERPWFGVGPGNYIEAKSYYAIPGNKTHVAHNSFLHVGAENGIPAMVIFTLIGIISLKKLLNREISFKSLDTELFAICQSTRQGLVVIMASMLFLSQQHNHFYFILPAITVSLERLYLEISGESSA